MVIKTKNSAICLNCGKERKGRNKTFCSLNCIREYKYNEYIKEWKDGKKSGMRGKESISLFIRSYLFKKYDNKCQDCGWSKVHPTTGKIPLTVEHIDGDWKNNREENLKLLCPNCHSLTTTYKSLNRGRGRGSRIITSKKKVDYSEIIKRFNIINNYVKVGKEFGVSDNTVRKIVKRYNN